MTRYYSTDFKQAVLTHYDINRGWLSLEACARRFGMKGGKRTLSRCLARRNELETKRRSGRPTVLNAEQINDYVSHPIQEANANATAIQYKQVQQAIQQQTSLRPSLRTVQRYGHDRLGIQQRKSVKRLATESK